MGPNFLRASNLVTKLNLSILFGKTLAHGLPEKVFLAKDLVLPDETLVFERLVAVGAFQAL